MTSGAHNHLVVPHEHKGKTVAAYLKITVKGHSWRMVKDLVEKGAITVNGRTVHDVSQRLRGGETIVIRGVRDAWQRSEVYLKKILTKQPEIRIVYLDEHLVVVDKPAGMTTIRHPYEIEEFAGEERFLPQTVADYLPRLIFQQEGVRRRKGTLPPVKAVHRLDKETSGLLVFARTAKAASDLGTQFRSHAVKRMYRAIVVGHMESQRIESLLVRDRGDGLRGSDAHHGVTAITNVMLIEAFDGYSLIECRLETGKTHQIRIHVAEQGHPICGEPLYIKRVHQQPMIDASRCHRLALHAQTIGFHHPVTKKFMEFHSPFPHELESFLKRLRAKNSTQR